jgi:thioredoxin reductase
LSVETVLIRIGVTPNTEVLRGKVKLDDAGYVEIDSCGETSVKRVFAAGDVANPLAPTVSSAIGMGATAAKTIFARLTSAKKFITLHSQRLFHTRRVKERKGNLSNELRIS